MRLLTLFSLILAAATVVAAMSGTGRCMVVHDDADAQTFTAMATTASAAHTPEQRLAELRGKETATEKYARSYAGNSAFALTNNLDYAEVKAFVDGLCRVEMTLIKTNGNLSVSRLYKINGVYEEAIDEVKADIDKMKSK